jgi:Fe-Mn family superoxide dismutase
MSLTSYQLPKLSYDFNELEPVLSQETLELHYMKHHMAYVNNLNIALDKYHEAEKKKDLSQMVALQSVIQFNGGGHINHSFFWTCLASQKKGGGIPPKNELMQKLNKDYDSFDKFIEKFNQIAVSLQGSGWAWLAYNKTTKSIEITTSFNHGTLTARGFIPLMVIDVWEHAYYLQYKNKRAEFLENIWKIINWGAIEENYKKIIS